MTSAQDRKLSPSELLEAANAEYGAHRPAEAVRLFREYLTRGPDRADVRVYLGAALLNLNEPEAALEQARYAVALDSSYAKAYVLAGRIYAGQQDWQIAQEFFAKALEIDESDLDAWYFSGRAFFEATQFEKAVQAFLRAGSHSRVYENLGLAYEATGQFSEAEAAYKRAVQSSGGSHRPYLVYGVFLFKQSRLKECLAMLREAVRLGPDSLDARFELGRALYQAGKFEDAISALPENVPPDQCRIHNLRGRILLRLGRVGKAQGEFDTLRGCTDESSERQR